MSNVTVTQNPIHETYFRPFDFDLENNRRAYVDANGTFRTAFDETADSTHTKVSKDWRARCIPAGPLFERVAEVAKSNIDIRTAESNVRITGDLTLPDGTGFTQNGLRSLMLFAGIPIKMQDWLAIYEYLPDLARFCNESLDRREVDWSAKGKPAREFMVRMRKDEHGKHVVRAVLSGQYARFDNHEACNVVENALGTLDNVLVSHGWTNHDAMMLDLLLPDALQDDPTSQWGVGFSFANNEIGSGTFSVEPYVFRTLTRSGYRWGGFTTIVNVDQRHIGRINYGKLQTDVKRAIDIALTEGRSMLKVMSIAQTISINDAAVVIAGLMKEVGLTRTDAELVARKYVKGLGDKRTNGTAFGIVDAIASAASDAHGERRTAMETAAGRLVAPNLNSGLHDIEKHWSGVEATAVRKCDKDTLEAIREILK